LFGRGRNRHRQKHKSEKDFTHFYSLYNYASGVPWVMPAGYAENPVTEDEASKTMCSRKYEPSATSLPLLSFTAFPPVFPAQIKSLR
jgi:hypothetical protein